MVIVPLVVVCFRPARVVQRPGQRGLRGLAVQKEGEGPQAVQELDQAMVHPQGCQHVLLQEQGGGYTRCLCAGTRGRLVGHSEGDKMADLVRVTGMRWQTLSVRDKMADRVRVTGI